MPEEGQLVRWINARHFFQYVGIDSKNDYNLKAKRVTRMIDKQRK